MKRTFSTRIAIAAIATGLAVGAAVASDAVAAVRPTVVGAGTVQCTATGKVNFSLKLTMTPKRVRMTLHGTLACSQGETGRSGVTIASGSFGGSAIGNAVTCTNPAFGAGSGTINWVSSGGIVKPSNMTWSSAAITDGTNVLVDLHHPATALTNTVVLGKPVARSYSGADLNIHIAGDPVAGGLCGAGALSFHYTGAGGASTLSVTPPNPGGLPVNHVVVLMQENRSADDYLAPLNSQGQPDFEAQPLTGNPDPTNPTGPPILPFHKTSFCEVADLNHGWSGTHREVNGGAMDGFTAQNVTASDPTGSRAMGYYDQSDLPFYYGMYNTFATGDRYFSSVLSQTYPNRMYLFAGTSFGHIGNNPGPFVQPSVFELLDQHSISWKIYVAQPQFGSYAGIFFKYVHDRAAQHVFPMSQYYADLANNSLPAVTYIDPTQFDVPHHTEADEHPPADVQLGQKFASDVMNGLMNSSAWPTSALFFTYDEHGGFYDHVTPPAAPAPDAIPPMLSPTDVVAGFDQYGVRVPVAVISPFSKAHFVSHVVHDHTSILRFIE
ncbi:MAG TPA: alkaline phosphatase family protein, partial [Acidimicrobiia bacterium]|nr:alkaline phosphatase family protein [Acidimicrobiia bacterium]